MTTVFSETRCADDARETVNEWCNDAWSRTTVVAPRRDNTYTGDDCSSPDACFRGLLPSGPGSDRSLGLRLMVMLNSRRSAVVVGWGEREIELGGSRMVS